MSKKEQHENTEQKATGETSSEETPQPEPQVEAPPVLSLEEQLADANKRYIYLYSEFDNYKKRTAKERVEFAKTAGLDIILALLPVLDDFERAAKSMETTDDLAVVKEGTALIYNKFKSLLNQRGLQEMQTVNQPFDSDIHDAITNIPAPNEDLKGKVIDEVQKGYLLNDKVIRHAKVVVGN